MFLPLCRATYLFLNWVKEIQAAHIKVWLFLKAYDINGFRHYSFSYVMCFMTYIKPHYSTPIWFKMIGHPSIHIHTYSDQLKRAIQAHLTVSGWWDIGIEGSNRTGLSLRAKLRVHSASLLRELETNPSIITVNILMSIIVMLLWGHSLESDISPATRPTYRRWCFHYTDIETDLTVLRTHRHIHSLFLVSCHFLSLLILNR